MPDISSSGTVTKATTGFSELAASDSRRVLLFAGTTLGTSCVVQYRDDNGTFRTIANGIITLLPTSVDIHANVDLQVVTTGSPNFNLTIKRGVIS